MFEDMTIDELDELSVGLKREIEALREKRQNIARVRDEKVERLNAESRIKAAGLEGIVASPNTAVFSVRGS